MYSWNTTAVANGTYTLQSLATDGAGNTAYSTGITSRRQHATDHVSDRPDQQRHRGAGNAVTLDAARPPTACPISKVQFVLTGGTFNKTVLGTADGDRLRVPLRVEHAPAFRTGRTPCRAWPPTRPGTPPTARGISVVVNNTPPTTSVLVPSNNATVSGTAVTLDATPRTTCRSSKVQFVLTGGTFNKTVIGSGTLTAYGYLTSWNIDERAERHLHAAEPGHR